MATLNYSTTVPVHRTVGEVQAMLAQHGADAVATRYADKQPVGVSFQLATPHGPRTFALPVDVDAVRRLLVAQHRSGSIKAHVSKAQITSPEHAARVAWRVVKDWLEAQLAIIEAQMATLDQVMLPYLVTSADGQTLYEAYRERGQSAIEAGTQ